MEFSIKGGELSKLKTGCILVGVFDSKKLSSPAASLDTASKGALKVAVASGDISGKLGSSLLLHGVAGVAAERVLLVGLGAEASYGDNPFCKAVNTAFKALKATGATDVVLPLNVTTAKDMAFKVEQATIGAIASAYRYTATK